MSCVPAGPPPAPQTPPLLVPGLSAAGSRDLGKRVPLPAASLTPALTAAAGCYALQWRVGRYALWPDTLELELARSPLNEWSPLGARVSFPGPGREAFDATAGFLFYWEADSAQVRIVRLKVVELEAGVFGSQESSRLVGTLTGDGLGGQVTVTFVGPGPLARSWPVVGRRIGCGPRE